MVILNRYTIILHITSLPISTSGACLSWSDGQAGPVSRWTNEPHWPHCLLLVTNAGLTKEIRGLMKLYINQQSAVLLSFRIFYDDYFVPFRLEF